MHGVRREAAASVNDAARQARQQRIDEYNGMVSRTFQRRKEGLLDEGSLQLSTQILRINSDFYTIWNFRKEILLHLSQTLSTEQFQEVCSKELQLIQECIQTFPKSYWVWHQRVWVLQRIPQPNWKVELYLCQKMLDLDKRNFLCWDYRRHVCKQINRDPSEEFQYTLSKIEQQFSNYSAWHLRSELLPRVFPQADARSAQLTKEFELVTHATFTSPEDQSAWLYQRWLIGKNPQPLTLISVWSDAVDVGVCFSDNVKIINPVNKHVYSSDGVELNGLWIPSHGITSLPSHVWIFHTTDTKNESKAATVSFNTSSLEYYAENTPKDTLTGTVHLVNSSVTEKSVITLERSLSRATVNNPSQLKATLDTIEQLRELEPDSKWPLLSSVLLLRDLGTEPQVINQRLERLIEIDPYRANYYRDLRSKYFWEDVTLSLFTSSHTLNSELSHVRIPMQGITQVWSTHRLALVRHLDLSGGNLFSLQGLHCLVSVQELNLNDNKLENVDAALASLPKLQQLHLAGNLIKTVESVSVLSSSVSLVFVSLERNPVCSTPEYDVAVWKALPTSVVRLDHHARP